MTKVLVVDDEPQILRALRINLVARSYEVATAATGKAALDSMSRVTPDVVLLDLGLPDMDGADVIHAIRGWSSVPIIVLTGRLPSVDKVHALDAGADDYVTKPFDVDELLARVRAVTRRSTPSADVATVEFSDVAVDLANRQVTRAGETVRLTPSEWSLIESLVRNPGRLMTQKDLLRAMRGSAYDDATHTLRQYMVQLRRKLEANPARPRYLLTEPGMGYRFQPEAVED